MEKKRFLKDKNKSKGITLVALVITIVIIIILASVTIVGVLGDNGLIDQAKTSRNSVEGVIDSTGDKINDLKKEYEDLMKVAEKIGLSETHTTESITLEVEKFGDDGTTYEYYINGELKATQTETTYTTNITIENKDPYIPSGFTHTEGTVDTGYVIKDTSIGNEFVWIPVKGGTYTAYVVAEDRNGNLARTDELTIDISELTRVANRPYDGPLEYTNWEEEEGNINDKKSIAYFKHSVAENSGFYMGRYEMGMPGQKSGEAPTLEIGYEDQNISGVPVCVGKAIPWINIDWSIAKENLESMYNGEVQSAMMNSYARTTTINWLQDTGNDLSDSSQFGNYNANSYGRDFYFKGRYYFSMSNSIINASSYISILEAGEWMDGVLIETGADTQVANRHALNNIYDLAGNAEEWSTERKIDGSGYRKSGGSYFHPSTRAIVDENGVLSSSGTTGDDTTSSRPILYK